MKTKEFESTTASILIVDDHEEILDFLTDDLSEDYSVLKSTNGQDALYKLQKEFIHLVVSDVMMPVIDGFELCKKIKSDIQYSHIPVILLTAKDTLKAKIQGLEYGADAYIEKPFSPEHLKAQIKSLLSNREKLKEHFVRSPLSHISNMSRSKVDDHFLKELDEKIQEHIEDPLLDVDSLADLMNMSRSSLYRKIRVLSDLSPNDLIQITRLKKASRLMLEGRYRLYEVSYMAGFNTVTQFRRNFQKQFGVSPSEYVEQNTK